MNNFTSTATTVKPAHHVLGRLRVPGDKSISHRYALLAALADGTSTIKGYAPGTDCQMTLRCLKELGVKIKILDSTNEYNETTVLITGSSLGGLSPSTYPLNAGNSGTTMRLLTGVLAAHVFKSEITGDVSLRNRPMNRVIEPLQQMGATIKSIKGYPPLKIHGASLRGITYTPKVASAQVKSAILLAGLHASGETRVIETAPTRNHTERALSAFGISVHQSKLNVNILGGQHLSATSLQVPGDLSSAAFWIAAAALIPRSEVEINAVGLNPSRTAFLDTLRTAGADIAVKVSGEVSGEAFGTIRIKHNPLKPLKVDLDTVPKLIDELPALAALAANGGNLEVRGAKELRTKESDRIAILTSGLRKLGATVDEYPDGFHIRSTRQLTGGTVNAAGDHRMAMAFAIAALGAEKQTTITGSEVVDISYPGFFATLKSLCQ